MVRKRIGIDEGPRLLLLVFWAAFWGSFFSSSSSFLPPSVLWLAANRVIGAWCVGGLTLYSSTPHNYVGSIVHSKRRRRVCRPVNRTSSMYDRSGSSPFEKERELASVYTKGRQTDRQEKREMRGNRKPGADWWIVEKRWKTARIPPTLLLLLLFFSPSAWPRAPIARETFSGPAPSAHTRHDDEGNE